jgi:coenzyme F420-reducing hydrogenase delta subunit
VVIEETHRILKILGVDERYLKLKWISASEGKIFAEEIRSFTGLLKQLGPNPLGRKSACAEPSAAAV